MLIIVLLYTCTIIILKNIIFNKTVSLSDAVLVSKLTVLHI